MLKNSQKVAIYNLESTMSQNFNGSKKNRKVLYYRKIVIGNPKFKLGIQMLGGKPIYSVNCTKSAHICASKFSNYLGRELGIPFRGNVDYILWMAIYKI